MYALLIYGLDHSYIANYLRLDFICFACLHFLTSYFYYLFRVLNMAYLIQRLGNNVFVPMNQADISCGTVTTDPLPRSNKHGRKRPHTKKYDDLHVIVLRSYISVSYTDKYGGIRTKMRSFAVLVNDRIFPV